MPTLALRMRIEMSHLETQSLILIEIQAQSRWFMNGKGVYIKGESLPELFTNGC